MTGKVAYVIASEFTSAAIPFGFPVIASEFTSAAIPFGFPVIASEFTSAAIPYMEHVQQLPLSYV
ncbi:hypothetical protein [Pumilibacter intestinalis]|uniref:hypothetical protein n=1 Tax=Pumilibacter intestinalis TaxID=2941511 RepID=UPI00203AB405|nr:hypothetical protein [Pumilibacter intestinalis]